MLIRKQKISFFIVKIVIKLAKYMQMRRNPEYCVLDNNRAKISQHNNCTMNIPSQPNGMMSTEEHQQSGGIPDKLITAFHVLEQETLLMSELSDVDEILKDLMELDDDFLDSLTTQICADFDMSKYTDSGMDTLSNNGEINLLYNSNIVVEPQVSVSDIVPHVELSEPPRQVK